MKICDIYNKNNEKLMWNCKYFLIFFSINRTYNVCNDNFYSIYVTMVEESLNNE